MISVPHQSPIYSLGNKVLTSPEIPQARMNSSTRTIRIASFSLIGLGVILLIANLLLGGELNIALPLVFLMLGGGCIILVFVLSKTWEWASWLYLPGTLLLALGLVFLLNVLTGDTNSWAYAWLLPVAGLGIGLILANWDQRYGMTFSLVGWGMALAGLIFFAVFGAIAGGVFIQIMAPLLLALGGLTLLKLKPEAVFPEQVLKRFGWHEESPKKLASSASLAEPARLVEPLSLRELEVLRLAEEGLSNPEIAVRLVLAPSTVKTHINNIYGKLGVQSRVQAVKKAHELGLLERGNIR